VKFFVTNNHIHKAFIAVYIPLHYRE